MQKYLEQSIEIKKLKNEKTNDYVKFDALFYLELTYWEESNN